MCCPRWNVPSPASKSSMWPSLCPGVTPFSPSSIFRSISLFLLLFLLLWFRCFKSTRRHTSVSSCKVVFFSLLSNYWIPKGQVDDLWCCWCCWSQNKERQKKLHSFRFIFQDHYGEIHPSIIWSILWVTRYVGAHSHLLAYIRLDHFHWMHTCMLCLTALMKRFFLFVNY